MSFGWVNPLYLSGLLLLALPVLIHLVQRQQTQGVKFPSLMFLSRIEWRQKQRLQIRHWLLLLLRCLLLLLVVLAFARPFFSGAGALAALDLERSDSIIVIDRSYSMRIADHWRQARDFALQQVDAKRPQDRIGVVMFDLEAEVASDLSDNADNLRRVIDRQTPGLKGTRLRGAIEQAARLLAGSNAQHRRILLVSDFQAGARRAGELPLIDQDIELIAHSLRLADSANATISAFAITAPEDANDEFTLDVELTNHSAQAMTQRLGLSLNGRIVAERELSLAPGAVTTTGFAGLSPGAGLVRGILSLGDDGLALDNRAYFTWSRQQQIPVLIVDDGGARANRGVYLENALRLSRRPAVRVERRPWSALQPAQLSRWAVIIVNDASLPGEAMIAALQNFVDAGGGLLVALGEATQAGWPAVADALLPGIPGRRVDAGPGARFRIAGFDAGGDSGDAVNLAPASVFSYRELRPGANDRVLASFDDGGAALVERLGGKGKALVLATTLDPRWNDLALQPVFLPFAHATLRYLAGYDAYPRQFEVGDIVYVMRYARALAGADAIIAAADDASLTIETPSGSELRLERDADLLPIDEAGFYQVHRATPAGVEVTLAANIDPTEANPEPLDAAAYLAQVRAATLPAKPATALTRRRDADHEQRQRLWQLALAAALALMLAEAFFANRAVLKRYRPDGVKA